MFNKKIYFTILASLIISFTFAQQDSDSTLGNHSINLQLGGQVLYSINYEYHFLNKKYINLKTNFGIGINENASDSIPNDRPIYGIQSGLICLIGLKSLALEISPTPTTYFFKSTTFININNWFGLRISPKTINNLYISIGYSPILFTNFTDPTKHYNKIPLGIKVGYVF